MSTRSTVSGFSLLELVVASVLLAVLLYAVASLSLSGADASDLSRRLTRAAEINQQIVDNIRLEMVSSVRLFGDDTEGVDNLARFDLDGVPAAILGTKLPAINVPGQISADTVGNERTGNSLFFCKLVWSEQFVCTSTNKYSVDVYRWVYYYLTLENGGPTAGSPVGLNLVRIVSEPIADGLSIDRISDAIDQAEVLMHLYDATPDAEGVIRSRCEIVWNRGDPIATVGTIRQISSPLGTLSDTVIGGSGRANPFEIARQEQVVRGMLYYRHHSVATNFSQPSYGVSTYAIQSFMGSGFPHGFEVQITGVSSARQTMVHLVLVSTNSRGHKAWSDVQVVVDARDM